MKISTLIAVALFVSLCSFTPSSVEPNDSTNSISQGEQNIMNPTLAVQDNNLSIQFGHNLTQLKRVIDVSGQGPDAFYIVRYAPEILNGSAEVISVNGTPNGPGQFAFNNSLDLGLYHEHSQFVVEVYQDAIDYGNPQSLAEPKGKGTLVVNDPGSH